MRVLVTGAAGLLGSAVSAEFGDQAVPAEHDQLRSLGDLSDPIEAARIVSTRPDVVVHCAALASITRCRDNPDLAERANVQSTRNLVELCAERGIRLMLVSTDQVFADQGLDGAGEEDSVTPMSVYGRTKADAEKVVSQLEDAVIVRLPVLFAEGPSPRPTFVTRVVDAIRTGSPLRLDTRRVRYPTSTRDVAIRLRWLVQCGARGVVHISAQEGLTDSEWAASIARVLKRPLAIEPSRSCRQDAAQVRLRIDRLACLGLPEPNAWSTISRRHGAISM
jgi:dTDP-4-dehydrorhamnose reductase